uniref:Uncharacterized protein n=1 Tax=Arundo donax TaxID=35708 RepID=A0A0A8ZEA9_ARUDO
MRRRGGGHAVVERSARPAGGPTAERTLAREHARWRRPSNRELARLRRRKTSSSDSNLH